MNKHLKKMILENGIAKKHPNTKKYKKLKNDIIKDSIKIFKGEDNEKVV